MTFILILCTVLALTVLLLMAPSKIYRNPHIPHQKTPSDHNIPFEEVRFPTKNGRHLYGWWIPTKKNINTAQPTLILVHGWGRNVEHMLPYINELHPRGFNIFVFDSRSHGSSDADGHSSMIKFAEDIQASIDFIEKLVLGSKSHIGVLGLSIGGASSIYASTLDPRIRCVITVGAFANPADIMQWEFRKRHIPYYPFIWLQFQYIQFRIGATFRQIAPENNIPKAHASILLIHGAEDRVVPVSHAIRMKDAGAPDRVRLWAIPGRGHSDCHLEPGFWETVETFFRASL
jgi:pimeloyl-ACP methyl ester carboxylesterase